MAMSVGGRRHMRVTEQVARNDLSLVVCFAGAKGNTVFCFKPDGLAADESRVSKSVCRP